MTESRMGTAAMTRSASTASLTPVGCVSWATLLARSTFRTSAASRTPVLPSPYSHMAHLPTYPPISIPFLRPPFALTLVSKGVPKLLTICVFTQHITVLALVPTVSIVPFVSFLQAYTQRESHNQQLVELFI